MLSDISTGFIEVQQWEVVENIHPVITAWYVKHVSGKGWGPPALSAYMVESGVSKKLKVREAIVGFGKQTCLVPEKL